MSEKRCEEEGESTGGYGDLGFCIEVRRLLSSSSFVPLLSPSSAFFGRDEISSCNDNPHTESNLTPIKIVIKCCIDVM